MFATGTAAVISPVGEISYKGEQFRIADGRTGELASEGFMTNSPASNMAAEKILSDGVFVWIDI